MAKKLMLNAAILLCAGLLVAGCHKHRRKHHHHVSVDPVVFYYSANLAGDTAEDVFFWDNLVDQAFVEFYAEDFYGEFSIEIYDDFGDLIYERTHFGSGDDRYELDLTGLGYDGEWVIVINTFDAFGDVDLEIY